MDQLQYLTLSEREIRLGEEIIGNVNDDGSISCSLEEVLSGVNIWLDEARVVALERLETTEFEEEGEREGEEEGSEGWANC